MFRKSYNIHLKLDMNEEVNLGDCKANIGCHDVSNLNHLDLISEGWCRAWCGKFPSTPANPRPGPSLRDVCDLDSSL